MHVYARDICAYYGLLVYKPTKWLGRHHLGGHQDLVVDRPTWTTWEWRWSCDRCMCGPPGGWGLRVARNGLAISCNSKIRLEFKKKGFSKENVTLWKQLLYGKSEFMDWIGKKKDQEIVFGVLLPMKFGGFPVPSIWSDMGLSRSWDTAQNGYVNMEHDDLPLDLVVVLSLWLAYRSLQMMFYSVNCYCFLICNQV